MSASGQIVLFMTQPNTLVETPSWEPTVCPSCNEGLPPERQPGRAHSQPKHPSGGTLNEGLPPERQPAHGEAHAVQPASRPLNEGLPPERQPVSFGEVDPIRAIVPQRRAASGEAAGLNSLTLE